jgi:hypothetical protein
VKKDTSSISLSGGALGGMLGNLAKAVAVSVISFASGRFDHSLIFFALLGIPTAMLAGVMIALVLRLIARWHSFGIFGRAIFGAILLFTPGVTAYIAGVSSWSADYISTWAVASLLYIDFGVLTGMAAGIMAGPKKSAT